MRDTFTAALTQAHDAGWLRLIPLLPLVGALVNGLVGAPLQARLGRRAVHALALTVMLGAAGLALGAVARLLALPPAQRYLLDRVWPLVRIGQLRADLAFAVDPLSGVMILIVTVVGALIHVYATGYMAAERSSWRFFAYLNLFVFSMLLLVMGDSFVTLFFGWEGVGVCSFLLIGFWYEEQNNASAGLKAFVVNRIGDWGLVAGILLLFWGLGGSWSSIDRRFYPDDPRGQARPVEVVVTDEPSDGAIVEALEHRGARHRLVTMAPTVIFRELHDQLAVTDARGDRPLAEALAHKTIWGLPLLLVVGLCLFIGAAGKSAQLPLYVWLPDAMAGPTPVSALIHAATMVTAGVYLLVRLNFLIALSPGAMAVVAAVGAATALFAAVVALFQYDIKKVLAYSTVSQLGFMFVGVGVGAWWAGLFHLITHACFKACLFLGAGSVIHGMHALTHARHQALTRAEDDEAADGTPPARGRDDAHALATGDDEHEPAWLDPRRPPDPTDPQDMRNMGGLGPLMPTTRRSYLVACWPVTGFPWPPGFFSKDEILARAFAHNPVLWLIGVAAALCTSFYMFRSYYLTFEARPATASERRHVHESPRVMTSVLWVLAALCLVVGPLLGWPGLWSRPEPLLAQWLRPVDNLTRAPTATAAPETVRALVLMMASVAVATLGWLGARLLYKHEATHAERRMRLRDRYHRLHALALDTFGVDAAYRATAVRGFVALTGAAAWLDRHVVDGIVNALAAAARAAAWLGGALDRLIVDGAVDGVATALLGAGRALRRLQSGRVNHYVLGVAVGVVILLVLASWL